MRAEQLPMVFSPWQIYYHFWLKQEIMPFNMTLAPTVSGYKFLLPASIFAIYTKGQMYTWNFIS